MKEDLTLRLRSGIAVSGQLFFITKITSVQIQCLTPEISINVEYNISILLTLLDNNTTI